MDDVKASTEKGSSLSAEGHPNRDFLSLLRYRVGQHAVDAERHEHDAGAREHAEHNQAESRLCVEGALQHRVHRHGLNECDLSIDGLDFVTQDVHEPHRLAGRAHHDAEPGDRAQRVRHEERRTRPSRMSESSRHSCVPFGNTLLCP